MWLHKFFPFYDMLNVEMWKRTHNIPEQEWRENEERQKLKAVRVLAAEGLPGIA